MILRCSLLFLVLVVGYQGQELCSFESHLCHWSNIHPCKFTHVTTTPLAGETGYLMLSKDTCKKAAIAFTKIQFIHAFQMYYFINGTGYTSLTVIAEYVMAGPRQVWSCRAQQGPKWNNAAIFIKDGIFDQLKSIIIEAVVEGDATVAIGNIGHPINDRKDTSCSSSPATKELNATKTMAKRLKTAKSVSTSLSTAETLKNTSTVGASLKTNDFNSTLMIANRSGGENATEFSGTTFKFPTSRSSLSAPQKAAISNQDTTKLTSVKHSILYAYIVDGGLASKQTNNKESIAKPSRITVLNITADNSMPSSVKNKRSQSDSKLRWSVVIGSSLFAVMLLIIMFTSGVIIYKRKIEILNVYEVDGRSLTKNLY